MSNYDNGEPNFLDFHTLKNTFKINPAQTIIIIFFFKLEITML